MLSDLTSFKLPVPHLGQDNMVGNNKCLIYGILITLDNGVGLCHIRVVSLAWGGLCRQ